MSCYKNGDFTKYWEENMQALGLWIPTTSFEAFGGIAGMIGTVASVAETSPGITVAEAFARAKVSVVATRLGAMAASYWAGAAIGSLAVAGGRSMACGTTIADALWIARNDFKIYGSWLETEFLKYPELLRKAI